MIERPSELEPVEIKSGGGITSLAGVIVTTAGIAALWGIASVRPMAEGFARVVGIVLLTLLAGVFCAWTLVGLFWLLARHSVSIDFGNQRIVTRAGLPFVHLRTKTYSASVFDSVVLSCGRTRGLFASSFDCDIFIRGPETTIPLRMGIDKYNIALAEAERIAGALGLRVAEERASN
ncbi:MAG: hypothetical protein WD847_20225 [Pirellulales bacterium]